MKEIIAALLLLNLLACNTNEPVQSVENIVPVESNFINDTDTVINLPQSETHILGDKFLLSRNKDLNGLTSPDKIRILGEFADSITAMRKLKQFLKSDSAILFLNTEEYHYTDKKENYILYKQVAQNPNQSRYRTYPKTYRTDGNVEIYNIRPNNFHQDSSLIAAELSAYYSAHNLSAIKDSSIMCIEQRRYYTEARPFCRFIKFNSDNKQVNSLTLNDYILHSVLEMPNNQFLITLAEAEFGARFNYSVATAKLIVIDKELNILKELEVFYKGAVVTQLIKEGQNYLLGLKFHVQCSSCNLHHCYFQIEFDKNLHEQGVQIAAHPEEYYVPIDTVRNNLRINHLSN